MPITWRLASLVTVIAILVTALGGWIMSVELKRALISSLDQSLSAEWFQIRQNLGVHPGQENFQDSGGHPVGTAPPSTRALASQTEYVVQLLSPRGKVVDANQAAGLGPLLSTIQIRWALTHSLNVSAVGPKNNLDRLIAGRLSSSSHEILVVGASLDTTNRSVGAERKDILWGALIIVVLVGWGSFVLSRRALRPVERLRQQVDELSPDDDRQLDIPPTNDEIAALATTMNKLLTRLQTALLAQRHLVADAGHELRTPLAIVRAELELAARPSRSLEDIRTAVVAAIDEIDRLVQLSEDILTLAQSDEGALTVHLESTDVVALCEHVIEAHRTNFERGHVRLEMTSSPPITTEVDPIRLRQVLDNLFANALRYAPTDSTVEVTMTLVGEEVVLRVSDRGPGFSTEYLPVAFERFRRPDDGRSREAGGAGLGLAIVGEIARAHRGRVKAQNREGGGAEVTVAWPVTLRSEAS